MAVKRRTSNKNPPFFSHEFVIQNHADIVACVAMVFVAGLMFQVTTPLASLFIALHHNVTVPLVEGSPPSVTDPVYYTSGYKDFPALFFYLLIAIVMHQIIQEYLLDKVNRKLHLSKTKHSKFNESGQLLTFYLISLFFAGDLILRENLLHVRSLWEGYPHVYMTFMFKFFFIVQLAYWLHTFPELYFQKIKREEMKPRIIYASLYLLFIGGAYFLNYTRLGLVLLALHYSVEALFHAGRLLSYADKQNVAKPLYHLHEAAFVLVRLGCITLAVLTFWYGLPLMPADKQVLDIAVGNFNTAVIRLTTLVLIGLSQAWLMWNFITFHLRRRRESANAVGATVPVVGGGKARKTQQEKAKARKEKPKTAPKDGETNDYENDDLTEVDQNTKKTLRQRK